MKLAAFSFSSSGRKIAEQIERLSDHNVVLMDKHTYSDGLKSNMSDIFHDYDGLVFISSVGIAVRYIAPFVKDKTEDPAVVAIDDMGRYAIPVLSGHIGGANRLATELGDLIGLTPVVTTASDSRGIDSVDEFAKRYNLHIESMEDAKRLTAMMVEGSPIEFVAPEGYMLNYENTVTQNPEGVIVVSSAIEREAELPSCTLRPKELYLGLGCRRGKNSEDIYRFVMDTLKAEGLSPDSVAAIGSIDIKRDERGLLDLVERLGCEFRTFTAEELDSVSYRFEESEFVKSRVGTGSVAEASAYLLGDDVIVGKRARYGITIAVSRRRVNG